MADAVRNAVTHVDIPVSEAIKMATCRPAQAINMDTKVGSIKTGFPASFVKFSNKLDLIEAMIL